MALITFQLDTTTNKATASIDGKEISSCSSFNYYSYNKGFELNIQEKETETEDGLELYTSHRACGEAIVSTKLSDSKKAMSAFASEIFKRKN